MNRRGDHNYGYVSRHYELLEDLAEKADWAGPKGSAEAKKALADYVEGLHSLAQLRAHEAADQDHYLESRGVKAEQVHAEQLSSAAA
ncbi:hypothetical protein ACFXG4_03960 [Nocardia sp. NPDC059246]|uniref:hypothetical protein n=1 Tax=unclassified Nocardia TaxID=2637762 RepID=UPI00367FE6D8